MQLVTKVSTTLDRVKSAGEDNRKLILEFYQYMRSKGSRSEHNLNNLLRVLISFDKFLNGKPFTSISKKEQIQHFLNHRYLTKEGRWTEREHDPEGRWITSHNQYLGLLRAFFRWLTNKEKDDEDDWKTPSFLKIKFKKLLRISPYGPSEIWERDEMLKIVEYTPELRDKVAITLLWDFDARPHEIIALKVGDIKLEEQYAEGTIPFNTKTGGGPILLRSSFPYVRDWLNRHPSKNDPSAPLICHLNSGIPINPDAIWRILNRLRLRIKRLVENDSIVGEEREKLVHFLRTKKWNPYCFRHSVITDDSHYLTEYDLKKKVRWTTNSKQGARYIKPSWGSELKYKILEHDGIRVIDKVNPQSAVQICSKCNHVNKFESKYCERDGCAYPLTQQTFEERKKQEESRLTEIVNERVESKDKEIHELKEQMAKMNDLVSQLNSTVELYKPVFQSVMKQLNPHLDPSGFEVSPFNDETTNFLRRLGTKET